MHELYNFFPSPIYALKYFVILGGCANKHNINCNITCTCVFTRNIDSAISIWYPFIKKSKMKKIQNLIHDHIK